MGKVNNKILFTPAHSVLGDTSRRYLRLISIHSKWNLGMEFLENDNLYMSSKMRELSVWNKTVLLDI